MRNANWFVGIRTPWTLSNEEVSNRTHSEGSCSRLQRF
ncbi:MAG: SdpI family protein [Haladaptatus sp.]